MFSGEVSKQATIPLIFLLSLLFISLFRVEVAGVAIKTNKMRYATSETSPNSILPTEQVLEYAASNEDPSMVDDKVVKPYKIVSLAQDNHNHLIDRYTRGKLLDEEDKSLLEKFYRETKESDPFRGVWQDSFDQQGLSKSMLDNGEDEEGDLSLTQYANDYGSNNEDIDSKSPLSTAKPFAGTQPNAYPPENGWTVDDPKLSASRNNLNNNYDNLVPIRDFVLQAKYSPTYKLLTSYDPLADERSKERNSTELPVGSYQPPLRASKIMGATLYGTDQNSSPSVSSKSAIDAIKMHDDLLRSPPRDGKVRVRMYYHRAIHDDNKLYGTGPWKYWGHGWGLEFGFDPKRGNGKDDFYQKGYTIERAFGRDFCKDKRNCRKPDPKFFKDPPSEAGKYSKQYISSPTRKTREK